MTTKVEALLPILRYALVLLPAALILFVSGAGVAVFRQAYRRMKETGAAYLDIGGWIALIVPFTLSTIMLAGMDVAAFREMFVEGWAGIAGVVTAILFPLFGFKSVQSFTTPKGGSGNTTG